MVSTYTPNKRIEQPAHNDYIDSWDVPVNADLAIIDLALGSGVNLNMTGLSGNQALTPPMYQPLKLIASGTPAAAVNLVVPTGVGGLWVVRNNTTGTTPFVTISSAAGGSMVNIPAGTNTMVTCDGSASGMFYAINTPPSAAGTNTQVQYNSSGLLAGASGATWDGSTLAVTGLNVTGNTTLGDTAGDTIGLYASTLTAVNGLIVNTNQLGIFTDGRTTIGTATPVAGMFLTVGGSMKVVAGGYHFPDGTVQVTAAAVGSFLPLSGGTLSGHLAGTSAAFSSNVSAANMYVAADITCNVLYANVVSGGPGAAGNLRGWGNSNSINFRWVGGNSALHYRIDETLEQMICIHTNATLFSYYSGTGGPTNVGLAGQDLGGNSFTILVDASSDASVKENIATSNVDALDLIGRLRLRSFDYIEEHTPAPHGSTFNDRHVPLGLVAQEVEEVIPHLVARHHESDTKLINLKQAVPYTLKAIQQLTDKVAELKAEIATLKARP